MPNWCNNTITLTHTDSSMIERAKKALQEGKLLNEFFPIPKELCDTIAGRAGDDNSYEQRLLAFKEQLNMEFFGYKNWYDFCVSQWGVKWDMSLDQGDIFKDEEHTLGFTCCTPWSSPTAAYEKLSDLGFEIEATYYEPGMMFCGYWDNSTDDYYDITGDSEWVRDHIPRIIDDAEVISEGMADWENEERKERIEELKDLVEEEKDLSKRQELLNELDALLEKQEEFENA